MHTGSRLANLHPLPFLLLVYLQRVTAAATNYSIDDTSGDSRTGQKVVYQPSNLWGTQTCTGCAILPNTSQMMDGTYHQTTWNPGEHQSSITMNFSGTAIYVFFTLIDNPAAFTAPLITKTACDFVLDDIPIGQFQYKPKGETEFLFGYPVFAQDDLADGAHTLLVFPSGDAGGIYINFDYAIYTHEDNLESLPSLGTVPTTTVSSSTAPFFQQYTTGLGSQLSGIVASTVTGPNPSVAATTSGTFSVKTGPTIATTLPPVPTSPPSFPHPGQKIAILLGATIGGVVCAVAVVFLIRVVYRQRGQHNDRQTDPYTYRVQADNDCGQRRFLPFEKCTDSRDQISSTTHITRLARQEALEHRLMTLEQEILKMATTLSAREIELASLQQRLGTDLDDDEMPTDELRARMLAMRTQAEHLVRQRHSDWAERQSDDLPPEYTYENL